MAWKGRKPKTAAEKSAFSSKISKLMHEGAAKDTKQAAAIAYSELRRGGLKRLRQSKGGKKGVKRRVGHS